MEHAPVGAEHGPVVENLSFGNLGVHCSVQAMNLAGSGVPHSAPAGTPEEEIADGESEGVQRRPPHRSFFSCFLKLWQNTRIGRVAGITTWIRSCTVSQLLISVED
jgi:hypothetical protein